MHTITRSLLLVCALAAFIMPGCATAKEAPVTAAIPTGVHHEAWDILLKKYVNEKGLVDYGKWKSNSADMKALNEYLAQFAQTGPVAKGNEMAASAINAYNAFAIQWILKNYPTESIQKLDNSFGRKAHDIGGQKVALDDIEHGTLQPAIGYRMHATLVCCARSCPPLQRNAYTASALGQQIDHAYRTWLGREDLNRYEPAKNSVQISSIFKWFESDFVAAGGVPKILGEFGPAQMHSFLAKGGYAIDYLPYNWGLNDQGGHGEHYSRFDLILDHVF